MLFQLVCKDVKDSNRYSGEYPVSDTFVVF